MLGRFAVSLCFGVQLMAQQNADQSPDWKTVLDWLPADTQTLIVASQPFTIPKIIEHDDDDSGDDSPVELLRGLSLGQLAAFPVLYEALAGSRVSFSVAGIRSSLDSSGLGLLAYGGCAVIALAESLPKTLDILLAQTPKEVEFGATVFSFSTVRPGSIRDRPDQLHLYVTQLSPNLLAAASDHESLRLLLERRRKPIGRRALPLELPEWKQVDFTRPVWAIRHYHETRLKNAQAVLFLGQWAEENADAIGIVYNAQPVGPGQTVYCLSRSPRISQEMRQHWEWKDEGLRAPRVTRLSRDVVKVVVPTRAAGSTGAFDLVLLSDLGFAIAL